LEIDRHPQTTESLGAKRDQGGLLPRWSRVTAEWLMNHTPISPDEVEDDEEYASQLDSLHKPALQHADREWIAKRLLGFIKVECCRNP
jgi:hypothetical protein